MNRIVISGSFDDLKSRHMRFLHEAAKLGAVHVLLWSDDVVQAIEVELEELSERLGVPLTYGIQHAGIRATRRRSR